MEQGYIKIAQESEIGNGTMKVFKLDNKEILLLNISGGYFAIDAKCSHMGSDLSKGTLEGSILVCPRHHSKFDVTNGKVISGPKIPLFHPKIKDLKSYPIKTEEGSIYIKL
jgi:3-phenylpropionate/trans-cinnamate dioxygenase ferredoxin component